MATKSVTWIITLADPACLKWVKFILLDGAKSLDFTPEANGAAQNIIGAVKRKDFASVDFDDLLNKLDKGLPVKMTDAFAKANIVRRGNNWERFFAAACYKLKAVDADVASRNLIAKAVTDASAKGFGTKALSELLDEIDQILADQGYKNTPKHQRGGTDTNHLYRAGNSRHRDPRPRYVSFKATNKSFAPKGELGVYWLQSVRIKGDVKTIASYAHIAPIMQRSSEPFKVRYDKSGRGAQEMICYFFDRASAISFRDQCEDPMNKPNNVDYVEIKFRKPDDNGYFEVETDFGKCYVEARRLHEDIEQEDETLVEETDSPKEKPVFKKHTSNIKKEELDAFEEALHEYDN